MTGFDAYPRSLEVRADRAMLHGTALDRHMRSVHDLCDSGEAILARLPHRGHGNFRVISLEPFVKRRASLGEFKGWLKQLLRKHPDYFATLVGYAYIAETAVGKGFELVPPSRAGAAIRSVLDFFDEDFDGAYQAALKRFPLNQYRPRDIGDGSLRTAEALLKNFDLPYATRLQAASSVLAGSESDSPILNLGLHAWIPKEHYMSPDELEEAGLL